MKSVLLILTVLFIAASCKSRKENKISEADFTGSESCIECHAKFYELWSTSHHGKAMQPINASFLNVENLPASEEFKLEGKTYRMMVVDSSLIMIEKNGETEKKFDVVWALGGKNVFYFLTALDKGKLQTIPLAYNLNKKTWYNNPESAVRHFPEGHMTDEALPWMDRMYTFNTSCYGCHVSQLSNNFDLASDSYQSAWKESGINCETCHGPGGEHVRVCREAGEGKVPKDMKLIVTTTFTQDQHNSSCAPCHAKMRPITPSYIPGDRFFDNYDLTTIENSDFYPDGRDLGENYTYTGWLMNDCNQKGDLHCVVCHTSSGRDRFKNNPNDACAKCHKENFENVTTHSGHKVGSKGAICVNCHMPKTEFGHMVRSDHSFRPPMPETTIRFGSPNACNICHTDKSPQWANEIVKKRKNSNYQEKTLTWGQWMKEAKAGDWKNLNNILNLINSPDENEVVVASFVRLLANCQDEKKWETLLNACRNKSPLVRSSAAVSLLGNQTDRAKSELINLTKDDFRVVRINSAASLASFQKKSFAVADTQKINAAIKEYLTSVVTRPDDWSSHYNLGIFYQNQGNSADALKSYEIAAGLYPESIMPLINSSVLYSMTGNNAKAEENLKKAIQQDPDNEAANLNLGLLLAESGKLSEAENALKIALSSNPNQAVAAYNLSVITSQRSKAEALGYAEIAAKANPDDPKYAYTLAYYQIENQKVATAIKTLVSLVKKHPQYLTAVSLLGDLYVKQGKTKLAIDLYNQTLGVSGISNQDKEGLKQMINQLMNMLNPS